MFFLVVAGAFPGAVMYAIQAKEAIVAIFTFVWTGTAAVLLMTVNNHREGEISIAREITRSLEPTCHVSADKLEGMEAKI